jgi:tRNA 2-(methylsulfanyl)-N6-isopentenyladenosine37 hydroxylase
MESEPVRFLGCGTPQAWFDAALTQLPVLLVDHANCEKKAAGTALSLMYRHVERGDLLRCLARLAREELRHFEQVLDVLEQSHIAYVHLPPGRYAAALRRPIRTSEPARLVDTLIVAAFIEARSCERFAGLAARLSPGPLQRFYRRLVAAEARHFKDYLTFASRVGDADLEARVSLFRSRERELILSSDPELRFHSGAPVASSMPVPS